MFKFEIQRFADVYNTQMIVNRVKTEIDKVAEVAGAGFKSVSVSNGKVNFYNVPSSEVNSGTTVAGSFNLPEEIFLDQVKTQFVDNFTFSAVTYPGATDPDLDGKPVFVLAIRGDKETNPTLNYSFLNMSALVDTYTASDTSITVSGYQLKVNIDPSSDTLLTLTANGLLVDGSGKANKVSGATAGNIATLDANGNPTDSGVKFATDAETTAMLNSIFGASA